MRARAGAGLKIKMPRKTSDGLYGKEQRDAMFYIQKHDFIFEL
jgi:hypothetical protein